jgi:pimeloyl-ACP methyl ester carboxylesterase
MAVIDAPIVSPILVWQCYTTRCAGLLLPRVLKRKITPMDIRRSEIKLSTGTLNYAEFGEGRPLLYMHAAGGPQVSPFLEQLAATHKIYAPIAPGFEGMVFHDKVKSVRDLAELYGEFAAHVIKAPCDVMGHSFGGWTALWFAVSHPDAVGQMVLEAPGGLRIGMKPTPPVTDPAEMRRRLYAYPEKAKTVTKPPEVAAANMQAFGRYNEGKLVDEALLARLPEIKARTLIVLATKDQMIPAATGHVLKEKIPHSHLTYIFDAAHGIEIDQPERMLRLVTSFLERGEAFIVNLGDAA